MYRDELPSFVPDKRVLLSAASEVVSSVFPDGLCSDDNVLLSLSVWSHRVLFPTHPADDWVGDSDTPPVSQLPSLFGVPVWYRECDMGLFWSDKDGSIGVSVRDSRHDAVSLVCDGEILSEVFVPPAVVSADPSKIVVFDGLRKSGLDHIDACAALSLLV